MGAWARIRLVVSFREYLTMVPTDWESARKAVAPYRDMTPAECFVELGALLAELETILGDRNPAGDGEPHPFWRHWMDPSLGRPE